MNQVMLIGNVGGDPDCREVDGGVLVAHLRLATTTSYTDKSTSTRVDHTEWHTLTCWRGLGTVVRDHVRKGDRLFVRGSLRTRSWEVEGIKRFATEVLVDELILLGSHSTGSDGK